MLIFIFVIDFSYERKAQESGIIKWKHISSMIIILNNSFFACKKGLTLYINISFCCSFYFLYLLLSSFVNENVLILLHKDISGMWKNTFYFGEVYKICIVPSFVKYVHLLNSLFHKYYILSNGRYYVPPGKPILESRDLPTNKIQKYSNATR